MTILLRNWKLIASLIILGAIWYSGFKYGVYHVESEQFEIIQDYQKATDILALELHKKQQLLDDRSGTIIREVYAEQDATGCADTAVPNGVLDALRGSSAGSKPDSRLF